MAPGYPAGPSAAQPSAGPRGRSGAMGLPIAITRQKTSKTRLRIDWDYPVFKKEMPKAAPGRTVSIAPDRALSREEAWAYIAGDDPRPMLVLRECQWCVGTEVALLSMTKANDRSLLYSQWFHNVKMPMDVLRSDHPFRNLFPEKDAPHLFLASRDGQVLVPLSGAQSQGDLWSAMGKVLMVDYKGDPERAVKKHLDLLAILDHIDSREDLLEEQIDLAIERYGPEKKKVRKLEQALAKIRADRAEALEKEKKIVEMPLRNPKPVMEAAEATASK